MSGLLLDDERMRVLNALGYPLVSSLATVNTGLPPDILQPLWNVHAQMDYVTVEFVRTRLLELLDHYDDLECQIKEGAEYTVAERLGDLTLRGEHLQKLRDERYKWALDIANVIGADVWMYSSKYSEYGKASKSINRRGCC